MIVGAWALIYTFRSWVPYDASVLWGRYHVFPLAGLALAGGAALQWMFGERLPRRPLWNVASVAGAAALLLLIHFAPGRAGVQRFWFPEQPLQFDQAAAVFDLAHEFDLPRSWLLENIWLPVEMGEGRFRNAPEFYPQPAASNPRPEEFRAALDRLDFPVGPLAGWERGIELLGASVPRSISQGGILQATLYWRSTTVVADDYTVFVHLRDAEGRTCSQNDSFPAANTSPTSTWQPGQQTRDRHDIPIDGDCPPGTYSVVVGLYTPADGRRLSLAGTSHSEIKVAAVAVKS